MAVAVGAPRGLDWDAIGGSVVVLRTDLAEVGSVSGLP